MRNRTLQRKRKGQTIVLIAGALVALIALVALAVDGGNAYNQRRIAQNAVDGATTAGMVKLYNTFLNNRCGSSGVNMNGVSCTPGTVTAITPQQNHAILQTIVDSLAASGYGNAATDPNHYGIDTVQASAGGTLEAYYIKADGTRYGSGQMGFNTVNFMDSQNAQGLTGIWVKTTATAPTYFARLIGQNKVQSDAHAGGKLETAVQITGPQAARIWPLAINVNTLPGPGGQTTVYHDGQGAGTGPGNWFEIDFDGNGRDGGGGAGCGGNCGFTDWLANGFNPGGPVGLSQGEEVHPFNQHRAPDAGNYPLLRRFPLGSDGSGRPGTTGVWLHGRTGVNINSECNDSLATAVAQHWDVLIPIYDWVGSQGGGGGGSNLVYHVIGLGKFHIESMGTCQGQNIQMTGTFNGWATSTNVDGDPNLVPGITLGTVVLQIGQ